MKTNSTKLIDPFSDALIDALGGTNAVAGMFRVSAAAVSNWRYGIPRARLMYLEVKKPKVVKMILIGLNLIEKK